MSADNTFDIKPVERFAGSPATFRRPKEFTCFSFDDEHRFHPDGRSMKYYYPPQMGCDLSQGFETFRQFDDSGDEHLDALLQSLLHHEKSTGQRSDAQLITWRGMLTKFMACPYDNDGFEMNAAAFQGTVFVEENHSFKMASKAGQRQWRSQPGMPSQDVMSYWGYKFETLSTLPSPWDDSSRDYIEERINQVVENHSQYCSVVCTAIGDVKVVIGGEVDAVWDQKPTASDDGVNWVELKTSAVLESDKDMFRFERKLLKYWIQSFLLGVPRIIVGMRSKLGRLQHLEELETQKIPATVKRKGKNTWDASVCLNFISALLSWLLVHVNDGTGAMWRISRQAKSPVIEIRRVEGCDYTHVLTQEFIDWRNSEPLES